VYVSKDIQRLNLEIETSIQRAVTGGDPELLITIDDSKLNLEVYQQIMCKLYAVIRYKIYQKMKNKSKNKSPNTSILTKDNSIGAEEDNSANESQLLNDDDIKDFIKELDVEAISKEVFTLFDVKVGLDTKLSLRKVQVLQASDDMLNRYMACLDEAHELFLQYILKGYKF
jgi:hypothetical protein